MNMSVVLEEGEKSELSALENAFLTWKWEDLIVVWCFQLVFIMHHLYRNRYKTQETHMTTAIPDTSADNNYYKIVSGLWSTQHNSAPSVHQNPSRSVPRKAINNLLSEAVWWATWWFMVATLEQINAPEATAWQEIICKAHLWPKEWQRKQWDSNHSLTL